MCIDYAQRCGISEGLSCFSDDFFADEPKCFKLDYKDRALEAAFGRYEISDFVDSNWKCPTNFSCVHGMCDDGRCLCQKGWGGVDCAVEIPTCPNYCSGHGVCQDRICKCLPGWAGDDCSEETSLCEFDCIEDGWRTASCCTQLGEMLGPIANAVSPGCGDTPENNFTYCSGNGACVRFGDRNDFI